MRLFRRSPRTFAEYMDLPENRGRRDAMLRMCDLLVPDDPPEYGPDDAEAQRIAEVFAEAAAELDRWVRET